MAKTIRLTLDQVTLDPRLQMRVEKPDKDLIAEYAEHLPDLAAISVVHEKAKGKDIYWLWDGHQTLAAYKQAEAASIDAEVTEGTFRDAQLLAWTANASHGLRRSNATKRHVVETMLVDFQWRKASARDIARHAKVSHFLVLDVKRDLEQLTDKTGSSSTPNATGAIKNSGGENLCAAPKSSQAAPVAPEDFDPTADDDTPETTPPAPAAETKPAPAEPAKHAHPWDAFNAELDQIQSECRSLASRFSKLLDCNATEKRCRAQFADFFSYTSTAGALLAIIRSIDDDRPAAPSDKAPGFIPGRVAKMRKSQAA